MYLLISAYDVLDTLHIRARMIGDDQQGMALADTWTGSITLPFQPSTSDRDVVAIVGEEILNMAYRPGSLDPDQVQDQATQATTDET